MKVEVTRAIDELQAQFSEAEITAREDGEGGAYVLLEPVTIGERFDPQQNWLGFHIPAQYPYADIYPVFMGSGCTRVDGAAFNAPVTTGHQFEGRPAIQISRRSSAAAAGSQSAVAKLLKVLDFLENLP